ncbi:hypothetical protein GB937_005272 [Aspergillus fischeri]|nr:hypothetical protein GB937_005272 [Aspergillus fischeri]
MTVVESVKSVVGLGDSTVASRQEMSDARLPLPYRDSCAHLLIPLNRCRQQEYYLPWKCEVLQLCFACQYMISVFRQLLTLELLLQDERHSYEKCQYEEFKKRVAKMDELRAAKNGARSN